MSCGRKIGPYDCCSVVEGDCLSLMRALPDGCVDAVITDPPYGVGLEYGNGVEDTLESAKSLYIKFLTEAKRCAKVSLTTVGCFALETFLYSSMPPRWRICWRKGITSRPSPIGFTDWEPVFVYGESVHRDSHDLFTVQPERMGSFGHPCPKPIEFAQWLIQRFCDEGGVVLDPFLGSGTTAAAAISLGCHYLGFELKPDFAAIARKRIALVEAQPNLFQPKAEQLNMEGL
jgi:site-specific DNA-methyltransferase (adenine-specific)